MAIKADVSKSHEVENFINRVLNEFGSIDILVNNAGITKDNLLIRMSEEEFNNVMDVNLIGFMKSVNSDYITGQVIYIDGGMVI